MLAGYDGFDDFSENRVLRSRMKDLKVSTLGLFATAVAASGIFRFVSAEGGHKGLWFGLVMSLVAAGGAMLIAARKRAVGLGVGLFATVVVGGWFGYEALLDKGWANAESRQLVILVLSLVVLVVLLWPSTRVEPQDSG